MDLTIIELIRQNTPKIVVSKDCKVGKKSVR